MKPNAQGLAVLVFICGFNVCLGVAYGGNCTVNANCTDAGQVCDSGTCQCDTANYYSYDGSNCVIERDLGESCSQKDQCSDADTSCSTTCQCLSEFYDTNGGVIGGSCSAKVSLGGNCPMPSANVPGGATCKDSNAICTQDGNSYKCICTSQYYDNMMSTDRRCVLKRDLGESCLQKDQCSDADTSCSTTCQCLSEFYDTNGGVIGGSCSAKVSLGGNCPMPSANVPGGATCKNSNAICTQDGNSYKCICTSQYYDNMMSTDRRCVLKRDLGESCSQKDQCSDADTSCSTTCQCLSEFYDTNGGIIGGSCSAKVSLGGNCPMPSANVPGGATCKDSNAICTQDGNSYKCICTSQYYDNMMSTDRRCVLKRDLGESCLQKDQCSDADTSCSTTCQCLSEFYDTNGGVIGGSCSAKVSLGGNCPMPSANVPGGATCKDSNAICTQDGSSYKCICTSQYYDNMMSTDRRCVLKRDLGESCLQKDQCSDADTSCSTTCQCLSEFYDTNGGVIGGSCSAKVSLGGNCPMPSANVPGGATCKDSNAICTQDGNSYKCICTSQYYDNMMSTDRRCVLKRDLGESCSQKDQCSDADTSCSTTCQCLSEFYDTNGGVIGGSCSAKVSLGGNCPMPSANVPGGATCKDSNAICTQDGNSYKCICTSQYYDNMMSTDRRCVLKRDLGESCLQKDQCSDADTSCSTTCQCLSEFYDTNGGVIGGSCSAKVSLGGNCPMPSANVPGRATCKDSNAICTQDGNSYKCICTSQYYDNMMSTDRRCVLKVELGYTCPRSDACRQSTAECVGSVCICKSDYYDDNTDSILNGQCRNRTNLEATCTYTQNFNPHQCSDANALCTGIGTSYYCTCNAGYYKNGSSCVANKALGAECFGMANECSDPNAMCPGSGASVCTCKTGYYRYNPTGGNKDDCENVNQLQVTGITFSNIQTGKFTVSWTPPSGDKASFINEYTVEWRPRDNTVGGNSRTITAYSLQTITGLTSGEAYEVKIISKNTQTQPGTTRSTFSSKTQASKPSVTSGIDFQNSEKDASDGRITVTWFVPSGKVSGYKAKLLDGTAELAAKDPTYTSTTFSTSELKNGYRYTITIQAESQQFENGQVVLGEIYSALFKTTPTKPNRPTDGTCSTPTDSSISLAWSPPLVLNGDLVQYQIDVYRSGIFLQNEKTGSNDTSYTIVGLEPGTQYTFYVYTENEVGISISYDFVTSGCKTKAKMSDKPTNLQITEITSRGFTVSWSKPNSTHSQENYGYILQIKDHPESCVEEIFFKCSDCTGRFQATQSDDLCDDIGQTVSQKTSTELGEEVSYQAVVYPDITYTVQVAATNDAGIGYLAEMRVLTLEEAPQKPDIVSFSEVQSDSLKVTWTIADPRPGKITFEVTLDADDPAMDKVISVEGFENRSAVVTGLQEYWNYRVQVKASTSIDSNVSSSKPATTLPAAPGNVSDFKTIDAPNDNYRKLQILWKIPDILERNGEIAKYSFTHNTTGEYKSVIVNQDADFNYQYSETVDVLPEEYYSFEVFAINVQNQTGSVVTLKKQAVPGVPINIEVTLNIDIIPTTSVKKVEKRQFTVTLVQDFFEETTNGQIEAQGLIACNTIKNCDFASVQTVSQFNSMDSWKEAKPNGFTMYRVTSPNWLETSQAGTSNPSGRRKRETTLEYTVGSDACSSDNSGYCNGPLEPDTQILLVAVVCTNGGCLLSREYGPFVTAAEPEPTNLGMIIGIVVAAVVVFAVVGTVMFLVIRRRRRGPGRMKPALDDGEEEFTGVDPALAKIPRKRPIRLSEIEEYVKNMHRDSNLLFSAEYEELKAICQKHSGEASEKEENRMRNRYINIIPFDHSRVKLNRNGEDDTADYINANYLPGYNSPREYIGCQGPLPGTIDDFWRMVWEQNVSVVVMLTLCKEGQKEKCAQYWPDEVGDPKQYGDVIVEITSFSNIRTYDYRMFKITNGRQTRVVKHFHFLSWLDFQANVHHDIILDFIQHVRQHVQPPDTSGPMIIHCSAGVGRTGTYICLDHLIQFINEHDFDVHIDIFDMVMKLRDNRMHMVQTEQQYVFIHDCVKEIMDRKRRQMENIYENQAFSAEENIYQNENLYANVSQGKSEQNTEL